MSRLRTPVLLFSLFLWMLPAVAPAATAEPGCIAGKREVTPVRLQEKPLPVDVLAITAAVLGGIALFSLAAFLAWGGSFLALFSFFSGITAFIVGVIAVGRFDRKRRKGKGWAWLGMMAGISSFLVRLLVLVGTGR